MSHKARARWKIILNVGTIIDMDIAVYALRTQIADTIENLGKVNAYALFLMIPMQLFN